MESQEEFEKKILAHIESAIEQSTETLKAYIDNSLAHRDGGELNTNREGSNDTQGESRETCRIKDQSENVFDPTAIYDTLIDPYPCSKAQLVTFATDAIKFYRSGQVENNYDVFCYDFRYWEGQHFKVLPKPLQLSLEELLKRAGVNIRRDNRFSLWKALGDYVLHVWNSMAGDQGDGVENYTIEDKPPIVETPIVEAIQNQMVQKPEPLHDNGSQKESSGTYNTRPRVGRPSDVSKLFSRDLKYGGEPTEPLQRRFASFMNVVKLCGIDPSNTEVMFPLIEMVFLKKQALLHFQDVIRNTASSVEEVMDLLSAQFLGHRAKRVNDEIWNDLNYSFVKKQREFEKKAASHSDILSDLLERIADLADIRTGPGSDVIIIAKTISAVRDIKEYKVVCQNPPDNLQDLNSVLRSCALEADRDIVKGNGPKNDTNDGFAYKSDVKNIVRYYVDRVSKSRNGGYKTRGYGRSRSVSPRRVPRDVCIICFKKGCHSSKHRDKTKSVLHNLAVAFKASMTEEDDDNGDEFDTNKNDDESHGFEDDGSDSSSESIVSMISAYRSFAAMGIYPSHPQIRVDAAMIDSGSSHLSTIGERLVRAAQMASVRKTKPNYSQVKSIRGIGNSRVHTKGSMKFYFLFGGEMYSILLYILPGDDPMILSGKDLDELGLNYISYWKLIERVKDSYAEKVDIRNNLPFLVFETVGFFSSKQLRTIHRNLGHPSVEKQMRVIEAAEIENLPRKTRRKIQEIVDHCEACQLNKAKPRRFLFSLKDELIGEFNHVLQIDVVKIDDGNVLHAICSGTGFQQGSFLKNNTALETWKSLRRFWINVYAGAPDYIHTDAGTHFTGEDFMKAADSMGVVVKVAPTEGHERIGKIERSHAILRSVYSKLLIDLPKISKEDRLSLSFRAINDSPSSTTGVSPTAMVFGIHPKLPGGGKRGSYAQRAQIVADCRKLATKMKARRIIQETSKRQNSASGTNIETIRRLSPGSTVLVYRENEGWKKYILASVHENDVNVILPSGLISSFGIHNVREYNFEETESSADNTSTKTPPKSILRKSAKVIDGPASRTRSRVHFNTGKNFGMVSNVNPNEFIESRLSELNGLQELGCFEIVDSAEAKNHRVYRHSFVDKIKSDGKKKSRFCVAAFNDKNHGLFTAAPTVKRISIRLMVSISASFGFSLFTRDVKKAFVMSKTSLRRPVYMHPPKEMKLPPGQLLKVMRTLYGMPEAPMHWFKTYSDYHRDELRMKQIPIDPCLWYRKDHHKLSGVLALQVDDTLYGGNPKFKALEMEKSNKFPNSGSSKVTSEPTRFNGLDLSTDGKAIIMDQKYYIAELCNLKNLGNITFTEFSSVRQKIAYASYSTMPDVLVFVAILAQYTQTMFSNESEEAIRLLKKAVKIMKTGPSMNGIKFLSIPAESMEVVVCIDAAFATNSDKSSQLGVLAMIRNKHTMDVNIIHFSSSKSKRVAKSVLAAELFSMIDGYDVGFSIKEAVVRMTGLKNVELTLQTDSKSLYDLVISLAQTTERRLQIDLEILREGYERREISNIVWIAGNQNPADDLTKPDKRNGTLAQVVSTCKFAPTAVSWIERDLAQVQTMN